jgi:hypothetical protein
MACGAGDRHRDVLDLAALETKTAGLSAAGAGNWSVRRPPACPLEYSKETSPTADTAHRVPFLAGFLGGEHCAIDFAKLHVFPLKLTRSVWEVSPRPPHRS